MKTRIIVTILILLPIVLVAQELRTPIAPIAPTDHRQCDRLHDQWQPILRQLADIKFQCAWKYMFGVWVTYGTLANGQVTLQTPRPCLSLARQSFDAGRQHEAQVQACRSQVDDYKKRKQDDEREQEEAAAAAKKAEEDRQERARQFQRDYDKMQNDFAEAQRARVEATRRAVEEHQRASAEAERQRHEASQRAVNDAVRDLFTAKERAATYTAKANSAGKPNVELTAGEQRSLDAIRRQADADGMRPRYVSAEPVAPTVTDASHLTGAVADLLGAEFQTVLKWGLNQTEAGSYVVQMFETGAEYDAKYQSFLSSVDYVRSAASGTATYDQHVGAVNGTTGVLSGFAFAGNPAIAIQLGRVVGGVSAGHQAGFQQLELLLASMDRPLSASEIAKLSDPRQIIQATFGPFLPLERIHHLERIANEGGRVYDSHNRGFLQVFGR
jgi:hypothetical protein